MKNLRLIFFLTLLATISLNSCTDSIDDLVTEDAALGGLVNVETPLLSYVIGTPDGYNVKLKVLQGSIKTNEVSVFNSFETADTIVFPNDDTIINLIDTMINSMDTVIMDTVIMDRDSIFRIRSNEVFFKTIPITDNETSFVEFDVSFGELNKDLVVKGMPISTNDEDYVIGDFWELAYESKTSEGKQHRNRNTTKIAVSGKYAGVYTVVESAYIHPTAGSQGGWNGGSVVIESIVNAFTYNILANGPFGLDDNPNNNFVFVVNEDNTITIPKEWNGELQTLWTTDELATCAANAIELPDVCNDTGYVVPTEGEEQVTLSHGYIRDTGTRQFRYKLTKNQ